MTSVYTVIVCEQHPHQVGRHEFETDVAFIASSPETAHQFILENQDYTHRELTWWWAVEEEVIDQWAKGSYVAYYNQDGEPITSHLVFRRQSHN
jgi:hypothetical protein